MVERVFREWPRRRSEFRQDFRRHGFSARLWELALFGYFSDRDYDVDTSHEAPDFVVARDDVVIAIEATTTNPPRNAIGLAPKAEREAMPHVPKDPGASEAELIFQLGKALRRKIIPRGAAQTPYWESEHVRAHPFVIAVEAFHGETSLFHGDSGLASYLFAFRWTGQRLGDGSSVFDAEPVHEHVYGGKTIPSGFFFLLGTDHVSAVIFSNAATISQFQRIGVEHGGAPDGMAVIRRGTCLDHDPSAITPLEFAYLVERGKHRETFATGIRVLHNPNAVDPVPDGFFDDVVQMRLNEAGFVETTSPEFVPFGSITEIYTGVPLDWKDVVGGAETGPPA
jgi:hypothetical protein